MMLLSVIESVLSFGGSLMIIYVLPAMSALLISIFFFLMVFFYQSNVSPISRKKGIFLIIFGVIVCIWQPLTFFIFNPVMSLLAGHEFPLITYLLPFLGSIFMGLILGLVFIIPGKRFLKESSLIEEEKPPSQRPPEQKPSLEESRGVEKRFNILGILILAFGVMLLINSLESLRYNVSESITSGYTFHLGFFLLFRLNPIFVSLGILLFGWSLYASPLFKSRKITLLSIFTALGITLIIFGLVGMMDVNRLVDKGTFSEFYRGQAQFGYIYLVIGILYLLYSGYLGLGMLKKEKN